MVMYPDRQEKALKKIIEDIDTIKKILEEKKKNEPVLPLDNYYDNRCVPIGDSPQAVHEALDKRNEPIVLLTGGVGKGKSTLARFMQKIYNECAKRDGERGKEALFKYVLFVQCGECKASDVSTKQLDILRLLASDKPADHKEKKGNSSVFRIANSLKEFLSRTKVLIILDNIADTGFKKQMSKVLTIGRIVLSLMYASKSELVSEEVLKILYSNMKSAISTFSTSRNELIKREILIRNPGTIENYLIEDKEENNEELPAVLSLLSLRLLWKAYLQAQAHKLLTETKNVESAIDSLVSKPASSSNVESSQTCSEIESIDDVNERIVSALCILYFDEGHKEQVVQDLAKRASFKGNLSDSYRSVTDSQRQAIEPII